ncbi:MAG: alanine--tRNA ligase [Eubacteriaceae bacterium]|nr:alanine--tRNA ligase [Eubacteriaceae bacterium]
MEKLGLNKIRELFQDFYESKGHYKRGSFPLIPQSDKSLLIINSGMAPMKPYFAGQEEPPAKRMTTCQKCIRTADIENVGITSRHGTFFEMLGSFSFGDYFKKESIEWGWEFLTEVLHMHTDKLWVTVYEEDDEAYDIWKNDIGFPEEKIVRLGKEDNYWEIGAGPCGPCSEIYYDRGEQYGCDDPNCRPGCDCDRYVEFWNHVFTQFNNDGHGNYTELAQKNIDTGMGLERLACIMQGVDSIFDVDTIAAVVKATEKATGCEYLDGRGENDVSLRIVTDHVRAATFMISDMITPGNEGRGYVLRRLIRRAIRHGRKLGASRGFLSGIVNTVIDVSGGAYPELEKQRVFIGKIITAEENQFDQTLDQGMEMILEFISDMKKNGKTVLGGDRAFKLHDTYGFPIDITEEILADDGFKIDRAGFEDCMEEQKTRGKTEAAKTDAAWKDSAINYLFDGETEFTGYEKVTDTGIIQALFWDQKPLEKIEDGEEGRIILDRTPFYAKSGGQAGDTGMIYNDDFTAEVLSTEKFRDVTAHHVIVRKGVCTAGSSVNSLVGEVERNNSARNHTATHMLHKALREVLGEHVSQAGSSVDSRLLRFDFNHYEAMTAEQLQDVENMVNDKIYHFIPVTTEEMPLKEAVKSGATGLFTDKYGDTVRVVTIGDYSKELCGGMHVSNTGQIGAFKILSESGIASGVRRIEAITGRSILERMNKYDALIERAGSVLKAKRSQLIDRISDLLRENKETGKELEGFRKKAKDTVSDKLLADAREVNGVRLVTRLFKDLDINDLRTLSDEVKSKHSNVAMVLAAQKGDKITFLVSLTDDVVSKGYHAGKMIKEIAAAAGGGGGGKADMAQAGGKDPSKVNEAFKVAEKLL